MSAPGKKERNNHGSPTVFGNLAYDLHTGYVPLVADYSKPPETGTESIPPRRQCAKPACGAELLIGAAVCATLALLMFAGILANCALVALSEENTALRKQLEALHQEGARLSIEHADTFSPAALEAYVSEHLDMLQPAAGSAYYIEVPEPYIEDGEQG